MVKYCTGYWLSVYVVRSCFIGRYSTGFCLCIRGYLLAGWSRKRPFVGVLAGRCARHAPLMLAGGLQWRPILGGMGIRVVMRLVGAISDVRPRGYVVVLGLGRPVYVYLKRSLTPLIIAS